MSYYKSRRITGWVIVDETGKIVNRKPSKDELKSLDKEQRKDGRSELRCNYIVGTICYRCTEENNVTKNSILLPGMAGIEKDKDGKVTGRIICNNHYNRDYQKYNPNSRSNTIKSLANCRTGNQNSKS